MRRAVAILLLAALWLPLVSSLFAATTDPEAALPACCRTHGKHHCTSMITGMTTGASGAPALAAPPCPAYPTGYPPLRIIAHCSVAVAAFVEPVRNASVPAPRKERPRAFEPSTNLQRGPPILPA